jgi:hypothetical protein
MAFAGTIRIISLLFAAAMPISTCFADSGSDTATQAVALFMRHCLQFAGDTTALRNSVKAEGYQEVSAEHADDFLDGLPGAAYDASHGSLALVLVSQDSGSCSVVADNARGQDVVTNLDATLRAAKIEFTSTDDPPDANTKDLNNREYAASRAQQSWHMLISTVKDPAGGAAMLTMNP